MAQWDRAGPGLTLIHLAQRARNMVVPEIVLSQALVPKPRREGGAGKCAGNGPSESSLFSAILKPNCNVKLLSKLSVWGTETKELYIYREMQIRRGGHVLREVKSEPVEGETAKEKERSRDPP